MNVPQSPQKTRPIASIESYRSVRDAAHLMARLGTDSVSVISEHGVCGHYSSRELIADVAEGADLDASSVALALGRKAKRERLAAV